MKVKVFELILIFIFSLVVSIFAYKNYNLMLAIVFFVFLMFLTLLYIGIGQKKQIKSEKSKDLVLKFTKENFNISKINNGIADFKTKNAIDNEKMFEIQHVAEEFLSNILLKQLKDKNCEINLNMYKVDDKDEINLEIEYLGQNYLNTVNNDSILSLKILDNKTKEIKVDSTDGKTKITFVL